MSCQLFLATHLLRETLCAPCLRGKLFPFFSYSNSATPTHYQIVKFIKNSYLYYKSN